MNNVLKYDYPKKIPLNFFTDKRGNLLEINKEKLNIKKFNYNIITSSKEKVLRGIHYNKKLDEEKLVVILKGKIFDVCVDLRKNRKSFGKINSLILKSGEALYIPKGFAHGYLTHSKENIILYYLSKTYKASEQTGIIWNDKTLNINWKIKNPILSLRDKKLNTFNFLP